MLPRTATALTLLASLAAFACSGDRAQPTPVAKDSAASADAGAQADAEPSGGQPKITADAATHEFGLIKPKQTVEHVFTIKNVGDADLHIDRVQKT